jgi:CRISPR-associated endonuclease Cas1
MNDIEDTDVEASLQAIAETYVHDTPNPSVCVADGHGLRIDVEKGHLEVRDGLGEHRRVRRYAKATHGLSRLVVLGSSGSITLRAMQWCHRLGIGVVVLDPYGCSVVMTSAVSELDDARIRRAQALAMGTEIGLTIARYLIGLKLKGQSDAARVELMAPDLAGSIDSLAAMLSAASSIDDVRQIEATSANLYWAGWESLEVRFARRDVVPDHWRRFSGRRSAVNPGSPRNATDPLGALLNYSYELVMAEGRLATLAMGLDPAISCCLHADERGRDSFVLDLESCRPIAEQHVARLIQEHTFRRVDFSENDQGVCRVLAPMTHRLTEAMPSYAAAIAPVVERVASILGESSPYDVLTPSPLTRDKHRVVSRRQGDTLPSGARRGASPSRSGLRTRINDRQKPNRVEAAPDLPPPVCVVCGKTLTREASRLRRRGAYCPDCLAAHKAESAKAAQRASVGRTANAHDGLATERRSAANAEQRLAEQAFELAHDGESFDRTRFVAEVLPGLQSVTTTAIARATGMSTSSASKVKRGLRVPHPRWWRVLAELA